MRRALLLLMGLAAAACSAPPVRPAATSSVARPWQQPVSGGASSLWDAAATRPVVASDASATGAADGDADQLSAAASGGDAATADEDATHTELAGSYDVGAGGLGPLEDALPAAPPPPVGEVASNDVASADAALASAEGAAALKLSNAAFKRKAARDLKSLGPISVGKTNGGALVNGVRMPRGKNWLLVDPAHAWGTSETVNALSRCIDEVAARFPNTHRLRMGHLSARRGGHLNPHRSHQSGRDADVGYYYKPKAGKVRWYRRANAKNLDRKRTWALVRALLTHSDVEFIFINSSIQKLLKNYALSIGENRAWLNSVFQYKSRHGWPLIRHARGHDTHLHVRFYNPVAQRLGVRAHDTLIKRGIIKRAAAGYLRHRARRGDLLSNLARRYGTTVRAIQRLNHLPNSRIRAGRVYLIPKRVKRRAMKRPPRVVIPPRRLPPHPPRRAKRSSGGSVQRQPARK